MSESRVAELWAYDKLTRMLCSAFEVTQITNLQQYRLTINLQSKVIGWSLFRFPHDISMRNSILACHNSIFFCDHTWDSRPTLRSDNIFQKLILSTPNRPLTCVSAIKQPFTMRVNSARKESIKITKFSINFRISNHL